MSPNAAFPDDAGKMANALLLELPGMRWEVADAQAARQRFRGGKLDILTAADEDETWIYVFPLDGAIDSLLSNPDAVLHTILASKSNEPVDFRSRALRGLKLLGSPGDGIRQPWHYTAQTDIQPETEDEFNRWFDEEHLPRLAAIPATRCARRYQTDGSPRYLACYDLETRETHGNPAWKAAASTPWRNEVHESFVNSRRMMMRRLG